MGGRLTGILVGFIIMGLIFAGVGMMAGKGGGEKVPKGVTTRVQSSGKWIKPDGSAQQLAKKHSARELIDRWNRWPRKKKLASLHARYAEALGLQGKKANEAIPHLSKAVQHVHPQIRRTAMDALLAINANGQYPVVQALEFWPKEKDETGIVNSIHGDAAEALAQAAIKGVELKIAIPALGRCLVDSRYPPSTKSHIVDSLVMSGKKHPEAVKALKAGKDWFYGQKGGLTVAENDVLRRINIGLKNFR